MVSKPENQPRIGIFGFLIGNDVWINGHVCFDRIRNGFTETDPMPVLKKCFSFFGYCKVVHIIFLDPVRG